MKTRELMDASMDTKRKAHETIPAWLSRVTQAWLVAGNHQICTNPDTTKLWLLEQGARLSPSQALQFSAIMLDHENDEMEDATNVLICLSDFGLATLGDDQFSVTSKD